MRLFMCAAPAHALLIALGLAEFGGTVTFEDVSVAAGLNHLQWNPGPEAPCEDPRFTGGAAAGDFDGDGWVDLYVTRVQAPNLLFRNLGDGTFEDVAVHAGVDLQTESSGCAWGDIDNDGDLDLYVLSMLDSGRNYLYINNGEGTFTEAAEARGVAAFCVIGCRHNSTSAAFGDYDRDGDLDLHVTEWRAAGALNLLFNNNGSGFFQDVTAAAGVTSSTSWGFSTGFADINNDAWPDLLIAADFGTSRLFLNQGNGTFQNITAPAQVGHDENGMGSAIGDIDNDGDLDWFVTSIYDPNETCEKMLCTWGYTGNRLYLNQGGATFSDGTSAAGVRDGGWGWGTALFDFDNDGDLDLGMTNGVVFPCTAAEDVYNTDPLRLWMNNGSGTMTEISSATQFTDTGSGKGFVVFDYDRDGDLDVYIANNAGFPRLMRNNGGNAAPWLRINLRGVQSNRQGIGARIGIAAGGHGQMREVHANSNYLSQNETTVHFGLGGGVDTVDSIVAFWPVSQRVQVFTGIAANRTLHIQEVPVADFDDDGDVDLLDAGAFQACFTGPQGGPLDATCAPGDLDAADDVDCADWEHMLERWTGPGDPPELSACTAVPAASTAGLAIMGGALGRR